MFRGCFPCGILCIPSTALKLPSSPVPYLGKAPYSALFHLVMYPRSRKLLSV